MPHLSLALLGGFAATLDGQTVTAFGTDKVRALLAYLAVEASRPHQRAALTALFWPDLPQAKAGHNLSQTLVRLRRALREDTARQPLLLITGQNIQFNPIGDCQLDVTRFTELLTASQRHLHPQAETCHTCLSWLTQATELYQGDFLAGFSLRDTTPFEEWQLIQQEALRRQAVDVFARLMSHHELRGAHELVQRYASRLVTLDPWHEQGHLKLMRALVLSGQTAAALEKYASYSRSLADEFGVLPSVEVTTLYKQIQSGHLGAESVNRLSPARAATGGHAQTQQGERRQVTALICSRRDSVGITDPEELQQRLTQCGGQCQAILERYGGHRQQRRSDGCLIYFGYPRAYEDAARRAVHAGLALIADTQQGAAPIRVGIHTGIMIAPGEAPAGGAETNEPIGDVPNIALSCLSLTEPNSVCITESTERLVRGWFDYQSLGSLKLAGTSQSLAVHRVRETRDLLSHLDWLAQFQRLTPFVGRARELGQMIVALAAATQRRGQIVTIRGEPGIGKSRLLWELRQTTDSSIVWVETRCSPYFQNTSLHPIINLLEQLLGFAEGDSLEDKRVKLNSTLTYCNLNEPAALWLMALLLGLPTDTPAPPTIAAQQRERMREISVALVQKRAAEQTLILAIEDLHWADPSSIDWLSASLEALAASHCLLLLTYRPTFTPPWLPGLRLHSLDLAPLNQSDVEQMVAHLTAEAPLSSEIQQRIVTQSDGVPLFIEELIKMVGETQAPVSPAELPVTLRDSLLARLDRVGVARGTLGWAAALGREFAYSHLAAIVPFDEERLQADLAVLVEAELINVPRHASTMMYSFKHALIQEAAHTSLLKRTQRAYHQHIAETYATHFPQIAETQPEILAQHYSQADLPDQAIDYWLKAGECATKQGATLEVKTFFDRALELIGPRDHDRRWRALTGREAVLFLAGERAAEQADIAAMLDLASESNNLAWRAEALLCQLKHLNAIGDYPAMPALADQVIDTARAAQKPGLEARALCLKAAALTRMGESTARPTAEAAVSCGRAADDGWAVAYANGMLALHEAYIGDYARAAQLWTQVLEMVRRGEDRTLESRALSNLGAAYQYLGQYDQARHYLEQGLALCDLIGDRQSHAYNIVNLGGVMLLSGDLQAAKRWLEQGLNEAIAVDDANLRAGQLWELGRLAVMSSDYTNATQYLEQARRAHAELGMTAQVMESQALLAQCASAQGRQEEARQSANQVWEYLQEHGSDSMYEAVPIYLALVEVFESMPKPESKESDSLAHAVLEAVYRLVLARAEQISEPIWRQSFLQNVPSNRAVVERWQRLMHDRNASQCA